MTTPERCPAVLHDRPEERVVCIQADHVPGAFSFICWGCLEVMARRAADREAVHQEWEVEE